MCILWNAKEPRLCWYVEDEIFNDWLKSSYVMLKTYIGNWFAMQLVMTLEYGDCFALWKRVNRFKHFHRYICMMGWGELHIFSSEKWLALATHIVWVDCPHACAPHNSPRPAIHQSLPLQTTRPAPPPASKLHPNASNLLNKRSFQKAWFRKE